MDKCVIVRFSYSTTNITVCVTGFGLTFVLSARSSNIETVLRINGRIIIFVDHLYKSVKFVKNALKNFHTRAGCITFDILKRYPTISISPCLYFSATEALCSSLLAYFFLFGSGPSVRCLRVVLFCSTLRASMNLKIFG